MSVPAHTAKGVLAISAALGGLSAVVATLASKPRLAAKAFGESENQPVHPTEFGLECDDVEYSLGCPAWWIPVDGAVGAVVIVHGFETSDDPRATDPAPRLELAALLARRRYAALVISLGYATGAHPHSGGHLEADDVAAAVRWARDTSDLAVAVVGFSAGGHAAVAASDRSEPFAIVTEGSFVDFAEVVKEQGASLLGAPAWALWPVGPMMRVLNGCTPIDLGSHPVSTDIPMLHLHGDDDTAINGANLERMAAITGGRTLTFPDTDHLEALRVDPARYEAEVIAFLDAARESR